jgi:hypothetical protein
MDLFCGEFPMVFNETILGALIIGVLVGGAILYTNSKSTVKQLAASEVIHVERAIEDALATEKPGHIVIRKKIHRDSDPSKDQLDRLSSGNSNEVRIELRLHDSDLEPAEIAEKIEKALQSGLKQLPFDVEVNINASSG